MFEENFLIIFFYYWNIFKFSFPRVKYMFFNVVYFTIFIIGASKWLIIFASFTILIKKNSQFLKHRNVNMTTVCVLNLILWWIKLDIYFVAQTEQRMVESAKTDDKKQWSIYASSWPNHSFPCTWKNENT